MKKILILLICVNYMNYSMHCCRGQKPKPEWVQNQKKAHNRLKQLIEKSDLAGVRTFTQTSDVQYIDTEACKLAKAKFEATGVNNPAEFATCNEFLVMVMVQALAPKEVKQQLGLPVD